MEDRAKFKVFPKKRRDKDSEDYNALIVRLNKIEGQVRGIKRMLENDRACEDVIIQVSAAQAALGSLNREIITQHIRECVSEDIREGGDEAIIELAAMIYRVMKDNGVVSER